MISDFSPFALWLAGLATVAQAYTTPVGDSPSGNPISKPGLDEIVPVGVPYAITWAPTTSDCSSVDLVLLRGPSTNIIPMYAIAENVPNTGSYSWTPSTSLEPDTTHYGIQLICDQSGAYQYTTQFGISNPGYVSSSSSASSTTSSSAISMAGSTSTLSVYLASSSSSSVVGSSSSAAPSSSVASSSSTPITSSSSSSKWAVSSMFPVPANSTIPHSSGTISKSLSSSYKPTTHTTILTQTNTPTQTETAATSVAATTGTAPSGTNGASVARAAVGLMGVAAAAVLAL